MQLSDKNLREKKFHNELQSKTKGRFENIFYKALFNLSEDFFDKLKFFSKNAEILDYGCGAGGSLKKVLNFNPKNVTGIDISEVSIIKAKNSIKDFNIDVDLRIINLI